MTEIDFIQSVWTPRDVPEVRPTADELDMLPRGSVLQFRVLGGEEDITLRVTAQGDRHWKLHRSRIPSGVLAGLPCVQCDFFASR